jgi:tetratricopeptide (TPR) repeat protein
VSSPPLGGERVTFTGTLAAMTHAQAADIVRTHGGEATEHASRQTTMLVVGEEGWPLDEDGLPSVKLRQVVEWIDEGHAVRILNESEFLHLVGLSEQRQEVHRLYTPGMLCRLLDVPVHVIRGWERAGLIRPVHRVYRLPYFDFREVNSVRTLTRLLEAGVPRKRIEQSLRRLPARLSELERPLQQLDLLERNHEVVFRDGHGLVRTRDGQRLFDFEPAAAEATEAGDHPAAEAAVVPFAPLKSHERWSARDWFVDACRLYLDGEIEPAIEAFRLSLMTEPHNPEAHFHLAECLYRQRHPRAALERYYVAVELDHEYVEAWTLIGCLHHELGQPHQALDAFNAALEVHPDFADAHYHKAETLLELGDAATAREHWARYLDYDSRGPWAETARQRLMHYHSEVWLPVDE